MKRTTIIETIIFLYAILFLYTGISKLIDYRTFKEQLSESSVLAPIASIVAIILPWLEFMIVAMLVLPRWRMKGFCAALAMMTAFTIYVITLLAFSDKLPCSCGGIISELSWSQHIAFNSAFIVFAIVGIVLQKRQKQDYQKIWNNSFSNQNAMAAKRL